MNDTQPFRPQVQQVRSALYTHFVEHGRSPTTSQLADELSLDASQIEQALRDLSAGHAIVLVPGQMRVWMAPPFSAMPTRHRVRIGDRQWWAPCIWDALGIPAMLGSDGHVITECPYSRSMLEVSVKDSALLDNDGAVHFLVPAAEWWTDLGFT